MRGDLLTDDAWQEGCRKAAALRGAPSGVAVPAGPAEAVQAAPESVFDLLGDEVRRILLDGPPEGMSATEDLARMDPLSRPESPLALGRALKARPDAFAMTRTDQRRWNVVKASEKRREGVERRDEPVVRPR